MFFVYAVLWCFLWGTQLLAYWLYWTFFAGVEARHEKAEEEFKKKIYDERNERGKIRVSKEGELSDDVVWDVCNFYDENGKITGKWYPTGEHEIPRKVITTQYIVECYNKLLDEAFAFYEEWREVRRKKGQSYKDIDKRQTAMMKRIYEAGEAEAEVTATSYQEYWDVKSCLVIMSPYKSLYYYKNVKCDFEGNYKGDAEEK